MCSDERTNPSRSSRESVPNGLVDLPVRGDKQGKLVVVQAMSEIPFAIKRMFIIYGSSAGIVRGGHANRHSSFGFLCVAGSCKIRLLGKNHSVLREETMSERHKLFWIGPMVWKEMYNFTPDCVLTVLSDHNYDPNEYVYDFGEYEATLKD